jgi:hypothetical protein
MDKRGSFAAGFKGALLKARQRTDTEQREPLQIVK